MIDTAMVMAAGHGTRMRPLTNDRSKAMVEVAGKPLIDHMLDRLDAAGIQRAIVNVHAFADHLEAHLNSRTQGPEIIISDERDELLETGGGVVKALPLLGEGPILICNIDAVWHENNATLRSLLNAWDSETMTDLLLLSRMTHAVGFSGAGDFDMDAEGRLTRRSGTFSPYVYAGVQIASLDPIRPFKVQRFSRNVIWNESLKNRTVYGHVLDGLWMHVGDPQALDVSEQFFEAHGRA